MWQGFQNFNFTIQISALSNCVQNSSITQENAGILRKYHLNTIWICAISVTSFDVIVCRVKSDAIWFEQQGCPDWDASVKNLIGIANHIHSGLNHTFKKPSGQRLDMPKKKNFCWQSEHDFIHQSLKPVNALFRSPVRFLLTCGSIYF